MRSALVLLVIAASHNVLVNSENILGIFPVQNRLCQRSFEPLFTILSQKGHNVTVASFYKTRTANGLNITFVNMGTPPKNFVEIKTECDKTDDTMANNLFRYLGMENIVEQIMHYQYYAYYAEHICSKMISSENLTEILKKEYDLILIDDEMMSDCLLGLLHIYGLSSKIVYMVNGIPAPHITDSIGVDDNPSYVPMYSSGFTSQMTFIQRLQNTVINAYYRMWYKYSIQNKAKTMIEIIFDGNIPDFGDLRRNISAVLVNTYHSIHGVRPGVPGLIEVGGIDVAPGSLIEYPVIVDWQLTDVVYALKEPLKVKTRIVCTGTPSNDFPSFQVVLGKGEPYDNKAVRFEVLFDKQIVRRSTWIDYYEVGKSEDDTSWFPFKKNRPFEIEVIMNDNETIWNVDRKYFCSYTHREKLSPLTANRVVVNKVLYPSLKIEPEYQITENISYIAYILNEPLRIGSRIVCTGMLSSTDVLKSFEVLIGTGVPDYTYSDIAVEFVVDFTQPVVKRNTRSNGRYNGTTETNASRAFPFKLNQRFQVEIIVNANETIWNVDGEYFCSYAHRLPSPLDAKWVYLKRLSNPTVAIFQATEISPNVFYKLKEFVKEAEHGVLVLYFSKETSKYTEDILFEVLAKTKERIVWVTEEENNRSVNINHIFKMQFEALDNENWLLSHDNVKGIISDDQNYGMMRSLAVGKPMLMLQLNRYDLVAINARYIKVIPYKNFSEKTFLEGLHDLLNDELLSNEIKSAAAIWNDRLNTSSETAVYWVERIIKWGDKDPLYSTSKELSFIQIELLDVYVVFLLLSLILLFVIRCLIFYVLRLIFISCVCKEKQQ